MSRVEEKLIRSVKLYPCLYNKSDIGFRNRQKRDRAWASVSAECGLPVKQSQVRWKTLRDRFVREYQKSGDDRAWNYYNDLSYLLEHIKLRGCAKVDDGQLDLDLNQLEEEHDDMDTKPENDYVEDYDAESMTDAISEAPTKMLHEAQAEFLKVMSVLESLLDKKLLEKQNKPRETQCTSQCPLNADKDPFYNYLESILNKVDESARADIQLEILNVANTLVKNASTN